MNHNDQLGDQRDNTDAVIIPDGETEFHENAHLSTDTTVQEARVFEEVQDNQVAIPAPPPVVQTISPVVPAISASERLRDRSTDPLSHDFDPSLMVKRIRSAMTEQLMTEPLRPSVPPFQHLIATRPEHDGQGFAPSSEPFMPSTPPQGSPVMDPRTDEAHSVSRDLIVTDASRQDALSLDVCVSNKRFPWAPVAALSAIAATLLVMIWQPSWGVRQDNDAASTSSNTSSSNTSENNVASSSSVETSVAVTTVAGGSVASTSTASASNATETQNALSPQPKGGVMGEPLGATSKNQEQLQNNRASQIAELPVRTVKTIAVPSKPDVEGLQPRLQQSSVQHQAQIERSSTFSSPTAPAQDKRDAKTNAKAANEPKLIAAPATPAKVQPDINPSQNQNATPQAVIASVPVIDENAVRAAAKTQAPSTPVQAKTVEPQADIKPQTQTSQIIPVPASAKPLVTAAIPAAVSVAPAASPLDKLVTRADSLIKQGAIIDARLLLTHVAQQGHAMAAFRLAETYDQGILESWGVRGGVRGESVKARAFYTQALSGGVSQARERLDRLK